MKGGAQGSVDAPAHVPQPGPAGARIRAALPPSPAQRTVRRLRAARRRGLHGRGRPRGRPGRRPRGLQAIQAAEAQQRILWRLPAGGVGVGAGQGHQLFQAVHGRAAACDAAIAMGGASGRREARARWFLVGQTRRQRVLAAKEGARAGGDSCPCHQGCAQAPQQAPHQVTLPPRLTLGPRGGRRARQRGAAQRQEPPSGEGRQRAALTVRAALAAATWQQGEGRGQGPTHVWRAVGGAGAGCGGCAARKHRRKAGAGARHGESAAQRAAAAGGAAVRRRRRGAGRRHDAWRREHRSDASSGLAGRARACLWRHVRAAGAGRRLAGARRAGGGGCRRHGAARREGQAVVGGRRPAGLRRAAHCRQAGGAGGGGGWCQVSTAGPQGSERRPSPPSLLPARRMQHARHCAALLPVGAPAAKGVKVEAWPNADSCSCSCDCAAASAPPARPPGTAKGGSGTGATPAAAAEASRLGYGDSGRGRLCARVG